MQLHKAVPLIVASSLIMQQIDSTAIATALPSMAQDLGVPALSLHSAITTYLLSLSVFLPLSGWIADRFGARRVFCAAIAVFTLASLACAASVSLTMLVLARFIQGAGAAMMLPTARLILVRSVPRSDLVSAMVLMSMPAVAGPVIGPLFGGFITHISSWHWIFWINLPFGVLAIILTLLLIGPIPPEARTSFDFVGFVLLGVGVGAVIFSLDSLAREISAWQLLPASAGLVCLALYVRHARRRPDPILDIDLFRYPTFRSSLLGGSLFRIGFGAVPFMLPLLMQEIFGYTPLESGAITFVSAIGAFGMRAMTRNVLRRFGFRSVLLWNALLASFCTGLFATFANDTAPLVMMLVIFLGGVFRALQFTSINTLAFAEVPDAKMSHATSLSQMAQRISQGTGVAAAAALLHFNSGGAGQLTATAFATSFVIIALVSAASCISFFFLPKTAGDGLAGREGEAD
ncbi:EmrB/QacA subfamily drug resistance transporter [Pseudochelatococcus lubricantis]|uniref:EmrB/QacA subfamily drug resistance transporter n=1 Tax=Pseudochelatococcus lubricantis TaxID=1538102 RepID=A0ABX0V5D6_9HYPH|nr:DHA2 family efflux MFS transporter permease subunit [Pseudochelatococcus lubricantis]NIJ59714.1 EmrB/QacA subfamily drug resistance transporter [Pseudochelatococcus lubricantis]